ncbi:LOW QUALITY PROTEIN: hypothetical protein MARPO_0001s0071 [Marchantia polymorpha]|uniref:Cytochrome P450 n=1 Tax=Marchantia polymorpha TaxID=3197 RepID=A0A2R6XVA6_MARPO|nr:LOW QUALITY PROTEIN: hypothetical protein MARPO_0001s0071 [Marchantia polymorpha]|eukprot:PTQ50010.1 LOW QUALITY PROTEIN: hypothetical protein MARPO_0001s0071 [Marchantia polymorpha]
MEDLIAVLTSWSVQFIAALVFLYVLLKVFKRVRYTGGKRPPGPQSLPLIGHFHHLLFGFPHNSPAKIAEKYGPIVWLELGAVRVVVVTSSDMARELLYLSTRMLFRMDGHAQNKDLLEIVHDLGSERYLELMDTIIDNRLKENSNSKSNTEEDFLYEHFFTCSSRNTSSGRTSWVLELILALIRLCGQSRCDRKLVEEADLNNLEYLQAVVKKTLRLRQRNYSTEATKVAGYDIRANTRVLLNLYAIGRDTKVWKYPLKFDPSRFLNSPVDVRGHHFEVLPFGAGRRRCVGMNLALVSVAYNIAQLIHSCTISLPEGLTHVDVDV